ncbi:uncharacterized protein LOC135692845 [Rhopilema esculentum]|uniref:uncharacterized protein LOC135692845 n=1 Tax=Rhopilema esculentum TaxID=499914 RepID=UPI0031D73AA6
MNTTRITNRKEVWKCAEKENFTLATYNILADFHIPARSDEQTPENWPVLYKYCKTEDLYKRKLGKSSKRHLLLMEEIRFLAADVICFQEVDKWYYEEVFKDELANLGYDTIFAMKKKETLEGLVTAVRKESFSVEASKTYSLNDLMYEEAESLGIDRSKNSLSHLEKDNVGIVTILRHLETGNKLFVCNFHATYDYEQPDIPTLQTCLLAKKLGKLRVEMALQDTSLKHDSPFIYCGDFNTEPTHFGYRIVVNGQLNRDETDRLARVYYHISEKTCKSEEKEREFRSNSAASIFKDSFKHELGLKSSYKEILGHEPTFTSSDGKHIGALDFIFYSKGIKPCAVLDTPASEEYLPGGPSKYFSSDHISLSAKFKFC